MMEEAGAASPAESKEAALQAEGTIQKPGNKSPGPIDV